MLHVYSKHLCTTPLNQLAFQSTRCKYRIGVTNEIFKMKHGKKCIINQNAITIILCSSLNIILKQFSGVTRHSCLVAALVFSVLQKLH